MVSKFGSRRHWSRPCRSSSPWSSRRRCSRSRRQGQRRRRAARPLAPSTSSTAFRPTTPSPRARPDHRLRRRSRLLELVAARDRPRRRDLAPVEARVRRGRRERVGDGGRERLSRRARRDARRAVSLVLTAGARARAVDRRLVAARRSQGGVRHGDQPRPTGTDTSSVATTSRSDGASRGFGLAGSGARAQEAAPRPTVVGMSKLRGRDGERTRERPCRTPHRSPGRDLSSGRGGAEAAPRDTSRGHAGGRPCLDAQPMGRCETEASSA